MFRIHSVFSFFFLLYLLVFGINGCGTNSLKEPGRYYNKAKGFSIKFSEYRRTFEKIAKSFRFE